MLDAAKVESVREGTVIVDAANEDATIRLVVIVHAVRLETASFWATSVDTVSELIPTVFAVIVEAVRVLMDMLLKLGELVQSCLPFDEMDNMYPGVTKDPS